MQILCPQNHPFFELLRFKIVIKWDYFSANRIRMHIETNNFYHPFQWQEIVQTNIYKRVI
jgi:hypothetical protein